METERLGNRFMNQGRFRQAAGWILEHGIFLILLFVLSFFPFLNGSVFCTGFEHDEGHYLLVTSRLLQGAVPYKDIYDNKLPALYLFLAPAVKACGTGLYCLRSFALACNLLVALILLCTSLNFFKGLYRYVPPIVYLIYSTVIGLNMFLRSELLIVMAWALSFFFLAEYVRKRDHIHLWALGFLTAIPLFVKPLGALGLALPIAYVFLKEKDRYGFIMRLLGGFAIAFVPLLLLSLKFTYLQDFFAQANGWNIQEFLSYFVNWEWAYVLVFHLFLATLLAVPAFFLLLKRPKGKFEAISLLFLANSLLLLFSRSLSFGLYILMLPVLLVPVALAWPAMLEAAAAFASANLVANNRKLLGSVAMLALLAYLLAFTFLFASALFQNHMSASNSISFCGQTGALVTYLNQNDAGAFYVFPSRPGYYFVLNKIPPFPLTYHAPDSGVQKTESWFSENVITPFGEKSIDHVLFFNTTTEAHIFNHSRGYGDFKSLLDSEYSATYFNLSDGYAVFYSRNQVP